MTAPSSRVAQGTGWTIRFGLLTDPGLARERNEDACAVYVPWQPEVVPARADALFLVADGMGGHDAGDVASAHAATEIRRWFTGQGAPPGEDDDAFAEALERVVVAVHASLLALGREQGLTRGAGSTLTALCLRGGQIHVAHVGDSRLYRLRDRALVQLTRDHTWVAEQLRSGAITLEEAAYHAQRHMLTRCLGVGSDVQVDLMRFDALPGDRYLLCSDGLHGPVSDDEILEVMEASTDPQHAARTLVERANLAAGPDNITAVVLHLGTPWEGSATDPGLPLPEGAAGAGEAEGVPMTIRHPPPTPSSPAREAGGEGTLSGFLAGAGVVLLLVALVAGLGGERSGADAAAPPDHTPEFSESAGTDTDPDPGEAVGPDPEPALPPSDASEAPGEPAEVTSPHPAGTLPVSIPNRGIRR